MIRYKVCETVPCWVTFEHEVTVPDDVPAEEAEEFAREWFYDHECTATKIGDALDWSGLPEVEVERLPDVPPDGYEVRHDMHGFYVCTAEEAAHEDAGNASVGFDGRPHYEMLADAVAASTAT